MKKIIFKSFVFLCVASLISCTNSSEKKQVTKEAYQKAASFMSRDLYGLVYNQIGSKNWSGNHLIYSVNTKSGTDFKMVNAVTKEKSAAFDQEKLANSLSKITGKTIKASHLPINNAKLSNDLKTVTFTMGRKAYSCNLQDYSVSENKATQTRGNRNEFLSPNGKLAAYIDDYNLWIRNVKTNRKTQLTFDGQKDFGYATNNAGWTKSDGPVLKWSPNSDKIATFQQDARGVGEMYLVSTQVGHPKLEAWKHPLPGDKKVFKLQRVIINLGRRPKVIRLKMKPDFQRGTTTDHVAGRGGMLLDAQWKRDGSEFAFVSSSRDHKIATLRIANTKTGAVKDIHTETVKTYYESGMSENWRVLFDSNEFIWYSEKSNWGHLYLYDLKTGKLKNQITSGNWIVRQINHIDKKNRTIYFIAGGREPGNPYHTYLYKIGYDGKKLVNLTPDKGTHAVDFSPSENYFIDTYSTLTTAPISVLRNNDGKKITDLETADISALKAAKNWKAPIEFSTKARDNKTDLYGVLFLPSTYDESKKYPVLNYIYPGPQSGSVNYYGFRPVWRDFQAVAELGFVVVAVDAMGTPGRSKSFHDAYYGNMGDDGLPDNITTIKQLAKKYKGMDISRVGIWGHSGGGFASTRAVFAYPNFYKVAVSGSGNHDNRNYEADWGEKWQGLLKEGKMEGKGDGTTNYDNQANELIAKNLKGHLLIAHGSMDNNVPPSNTMLVVQALIKANKDFDMIIFPNKRHGYGDMTNYMTRKRWDYFVKYLRNEIPPKEFKIE